MMNEQERLWALHWWCGYVFMNLKKLLEYGATAAAVSSLRGGNGGHGGDGGSGGAGGRVDEEPQNKAHAEGRHSRIYRP